jgi:predicted RNase H-like HicB family nuclease
MILEYIDAAMCLATYEVLADDGLFYGEIPGFDGVYATAKKLEDCRNELKATLEDWLLLSPNKNLPSLSSMVFRWK